MGLIGNLEIGNIGYPLMSVSVDPQDEYVGMNYLSWKMEREEGGHGGKRPGSNGSTLGVIWIRDKMGDTSNLSKRDYKET